MFTTKSIMLLRNKVIFVLIIISLILLIINVVIDSKKENEEKPINKSEFSSAIEKTFLKILEEYGIKDEWIKKIPINDERFDSLKFIYRVIIPHDVPIPLIIIGLNSVFSEDYFNVTSQEQEYHKKATINIFASNILKLQVSIKQTPDIERDSKMFSFLITTDPDTSDADFIRMIHLPYFFSIVLPPSKTAADVSQIIVSNGKKLAILIHDEIDDTDFQLSNEFEKSRLKRAVANISATFRNTTLFIVDDNSKLFKSAVYNYVEDEFKKRGINIFLLSHFINLDKENRNELISTFEFYCESSRPGDKKFFILTRESFFELLEEINLFKKKGNQIVFADELLGG